MTERLLLDTHAWLWFTLGTRPFTEAARIFIGKARRERTLFVAAISLHEVAYAQHRNRVDLRIPLADWFIQAIDRSNIQILPLTTSVAIKSAALPSSFHGDPSDRLIAATAIAHDLTL